MQFTIRHRTFNRRKWRCSKKKKLTTNFISAVYKKVKSTNASLEISTQLPKPSQTAFAAEPIISETEQPIIMEKTAVINTSNNTKTENTFSLSKLAAIKQQAKAAVDSKNQKIKVVPTLENCTTFWANYLEENTKNKAFFKKSLLECKLGLQAETLTIIATDEMGYEFLVNIKQALCLELQDNFNNTDIRLLIELFIDPNHVKQTVKSSREIIEEMVARFPLINDLRNSLGLELEIG